MPDVKEQAIHDSMPPPRAAPVQDKRFLFLQEMCFHAGVVDDGIKGLQVLGTSLVDHSGSSGLFEYEATSPDLTPEQFMKSARWSRRMLLGRTMAGNANTADVANDVWNGALEETIRGWLQGPFSEGRMSDMLGPVFVASPRFRLQQTDMVRAIDDMSISLVNFSFAADYRLLLDGVGGISPLGRSMLEAGSR